MATTAKASGAPVPNLLPLCRHKCSHQQQQYQKQWQQQQQQHHVKWKPELPDRVLKPKLAQNGNGNWNSNESGSSPSVYSYATPPISHLAPSPARSSFMSNSSNNIQHHTPHRRVNSVNPMVAKVSALPRKWCDMVFRRNNDNNLYKSESFRFIQKTSSLEPLLPKNAFIRNRLRKAAIPVSDDYVEPLDQLISTTTYAQSQDSGSDRLNAGFGTESEEPSYHEIPEKYNAPYYYSDTLKTTPVDERKGPAEEESNRNESGETKVNDDEDKSKIPSITFILYNHHESCPLSHVSPVNTAKLREKSQSCHCFFSAEEAQAALSMARKRYETAFLPTNCPPPRASPDVDSMLLGIESNNTLALDNNTGEMYFVKNNTSLEDDDDLLPRPTRRDFSNPPSKYNVVSGVTVIHCHPHSSDNSPVRSRDNTMGSTGSSTTTKIVPLSEPLPQKKYISYLSTGSSSTQSTSSTGCSTTMSSSPSQTSSRTGSGRTSGLRLYELSHNRNNMAVLLKDNSISSLESIDSLTSEDTKYNQSTSNSCQQQRLGQQLKTAKLLSPISDKSPLEPPIHSSTSTVSNASQNTNEYQNFRQQQQKPPSFPRTNETNAQQQQLPIWSPQNLSSAAELTNVPWEMPRLRRKLALLADSGISLDFPSARCENEDNAHAYKKDFKLNTTVAGQELKEGQRPVLVEESKQQTRPNMQNSSLHIRANLDLSLTKSSNEYDPQLSYHECEADEYYEPQAMKCGLPKLPSAPPPLEPSGSGRRCRPDKLKMKLDFGPAFEIDPTIELDGQEWFHGAITRVESEAILRTTKEGSFLVRNCESSTFCRYSLSTKSTRGFIHIRIEPNSLGTYSLAEHEFPTVSHMVLHFMSHRLPIKGAEHVKLKYPVITQLL